MGSYADYWLGKFRLGSTRNDPYHDTMLLFRASDKRISTVKNTDELPVQLRDWKDYYEEDDDDEINLVYYSASLEHVKDRLELIGYTFGVAKEVYNILLTKEVDRLQDSIKKHPHLSDLRSNLSILQSMTIEKWLSNLRIIYDNDFEKDLSNIIYNPILSYMLNHGFYGFPGFDINALIRLAIEIIPDEDVLIYDISDLVIQGWYDIDDDHTKSETSDVSDQEYDSNGKIILLTEGKFDTWVLSESLNLLYPHLSYRYSFLDFDSSRYGGGAPSLAILLKAFSGVGIIHKVIAIFDNDAAGHVELERIKEVKIPRNIKYITLPEIDILKNYPTIGPTGTEKINVNGMAGSIDMYLEKYALTDNNSNYQLIQWKEYMKTIDRYHGGLIDKKAVQEKFKNQINHCKKDNSAISQYDWTEIKEIFKRIFMVFHEEDKNIIISLAEEYA